MRPAPSTLPRSAEAASDPTATSVAASACPAFTTAAACVHDATHTTVTSVVTQQRLSVLHGRCGRRCSWCRRCTHKSPQQQLDPTPVAAIRAPQCRLFDTQDGGSQASGASRLVPASSCARKPTKCAGSPAAQASVGPGCIPPPHLAGRCRWGPACSCALYSHAAGVTVSAAPPLPAPRRPDNPPHSSSCPPSSPSP